MTTSSIPEQARALVGARRTRMCLVTEREARRFAQAIGSASPEVAPGDASDFIVPLLFPQVFTFEDVDPALLPEDGSPVELDVPLPATRAVGGGSEYEIVRRARVGEVLSVTSTLVDVYAKEGRSGPLYFVVVETVFRASDGDLVARETATYIKRV